jgi:hypothetical protein
MRYCRRGAARAVAALLVIQVSSRSGGLEAVHARPGRAAQPTVSGTPSTGKCQLRVFTINRGKLDEFTQAWRAGVYPLRRKHGFTVPVAWAVPDTNQFVWLLCYAGPEDWEAKDRAYYASEERVRLDPDPRQLIARAERWFVTPVVAGP